jgi:undecaprenyl-diphosphatase
MLLWTIIQSIILGLIQGATEFIPISSSAHLIIVPWLFGWENPALTSLPFDVALHLGTLLAVLVFFAKDWVVLVKAGVQSIVERRIGNDPNRRLAWFIILGTIPGAISGFLFESKIDGLFHQPGKPILQPAMITMGLIIAILGGLLMLADRLARHQRDMDHVTILDTLWIGLAQALAIFPGVSRSGATISAGLGLGLKRETAAKFSFLLSAPIIAGAGLKSLYEIYSGIKTGAIAGSEMILFPIGFLAAAISGYLCIRFLLNYLQKHSLSVFVYYRWALAALVILVALIRG